MDEKRRVLARRRFLRAVAAVPLAAWGASAAAQDACLDASALSAGDQALRKSLGFRPQSEDPKRMCGGCAFFTAAEAPGCGTCTLLSGGPVASVSRCDSWAARR